MLDKLRTEIDERAATYSNNDDMVAALRNLATVLASVETDMQTREDIAAYLLSQSRQFSGPKRAAMVGCANYIRHGWW